MAQIHADKKSLDAALEHIKKAPKKEGLVELIVCRPDVNQRRELEICQLTTENGLVGDNWKARGFKRSPDGAAHPEMQLNIMNVRAISAIASEKEDWKLAGDQFFVDFDLCKDNLPPGTRLKMGTAVIEVTAEPHLGCKKFKDRFGADSVKFVNSDEGKMLNLRGINAKVVEDGEVKLGDFITKL